jgi:hypothetical protein
MPEFEATCLRCDAKFAMTEANVARILASYKAWDVDHGCTDPLPIEEAGNE